MHPEQKSDEYLILNATNETFRTLVGWATKRLGIVAYDNEGNTIQKMFPVFVKKTELQASLTQEEIDAIEGDLFSRWWEER